MLDTSSDVGGQAADRAQPAGTSSHPQRGPAETPPEVMLTANTTDSGAAPPNEVAQAGTADWESGQFVFPGFPPGGSGEDDSAASPELRHAANEFAEQASRIASSDLEQLTSQVAHLQGLNGAATDKFNEMADFGRGMSVFLEALEDKQQGVEPLMAEIDALDSQMTALEAMLERLDAATSQLNDKIAEANSSNHA